MGATAPKSPTLFGREDPIGGTDSPFGGGLEAVFRGGEQRDGAGGAWKLTAQALRNQAKVFFPGGAGLKEASEFANLSNFGSLAAGVVEQVTDLLVRGCQLFLRGLAPGDFLLLLELSEGQPQGKSDEGCSHGHVGENFSVCLFPAVHQQIDAAEQPYQDQVGDDEAEEIRGLLGGLWLGGGFPSECDDPAATVGTAQPRLNHAAAGT